MKSRFAGRKKNCLCFCRNAAREFPSHSQIDKVICVSEGEGMRYHAFWSLGRRAEEDAISPTLQTLHFRRSITHNDFSSLPFPSLPIPKQPLEIRLESELMLHQPAYTKAVRKWPAPVRVLFALFTVRYPTLYNQIADTNLQVIIVCIHPQGPQSLNNYWITVSPSITLQAQTRPPETTQTAGYATTIIHDSRIANERACP